MVHFPVCHVSLPKGKTVITYLLVVGDDQPMGNGYLWLELLSPPIWIGSFPPNEAVSEFSSPPDHGWSPGHPSPMGARCVVCSKKNNCPATRGLAFLDGGFNLPLCKIWKSVGMMKFPIYGKCMFQTTNQRWFLDRKSVTFREKPWKTHESWKKKRPTVLLMAIAKSWDGMGKISHSSHERSWESTISPARAPMGSSQLGIIWYSII